MRWREPHPISKGFSFFSIACSATKAGQFWRISPFVCTGIHCFCSIGPLVLFVGVSFAWFFFVCLWISGLPEGNEFLWPSQSISSPAQIYYGNTRGEQNGGKRNCMDIRLYYAGSAGAKWRASFAGVCQGVLKQRTNLCSENALNLHATITSQSMLCYLVVKSFMFPQPWRRIKLGLYFILQCLLD